MTDTWTPPSGPCAVFNDGWVGTPAPESMLLVMADAIAAEFHGVRRWTGEPAAHFVEDMFWLAADPNPDFLVVKS